MHSEEIDSPPVPWMHGAAGILGGATSMAIFYPLDLLRTRAHVTNGDGSRLRSAKTLLRQEGIRGLYRGVTMAVCAHSIGWGTYLTLFRTMQNFFQALNHDHPGVAVDFSAACVAAVSTATLVTPLNLIKTRVQLHDGNGEKPKNALAALRIVAQTEGVRRMFRGLGPQILLSSHTTIQVAMYEFIKRNWWRSDDAPPTMGVAFASGVSKAFAAVICNPLEVCRTRLQDKRNVAGDQYRTMTSAFNTIWQAEGVRGLYRGTAVNLCRVVPTTVVAFVLYEKCLTAFNYLASRRRLRRPASATVGALTK